MNSEDNSDKESSSDEDDRDLAMLPPIQKANAWTNIDSDASDDMKNGLVHHLPRRLINPTCDSGLLDKGNKQKSVQRTQPRNRESRKSAARNWRKDTDLQSEEEWKEIIKSPIEEFKKAMCSDDLVLHLINETNLYTVQHGKAHFKILDDEIRTFIAVLLLSGYCKVPSLLGRFT